MGETRIYIHHVVGTYQPYYRLSAFLNPTVILMKLKFFNFNAAAKSSRELHEVIDDDFDEVEHVTKLLQYELTNLKKQGDKTDE